VISAWDQDDVVIASPGVGRYRFTHVVIVASLLKRWAGSPLPDTLVKAIVAIAVQGDTAPERVRIKRISDVTRDTLSGFVLDNICTWGSATCAGANLAAPRNARQLPAADTPMTRPDIAFINPNHAAQQLTTREHHRPAQLVQHAHAV
jgi:hypothetical protein